MLEGYTRWLVRRRWLVLAAVTVATLAVGAGMGKLRTEFNVEASLPDNHEFIQIDKAIRADFGGRNTIIVGVVPRDGGEVWRPEILSVVRDLTLRALKLPDVISQNVVSLAAPSVRHVEEAGGSISVDYLMREVPEAPRDIAVLRAKLESSPQLKGMLVTDDQKAALVILDFWVGPPAHELASRVTSLLGEFKDRPVDLWASGEPMISLIDVEQSREAAQRLPITFLVIGLMLLVSFRNLQGMVIPMLTAALSTIWALGLMGHTGIVIDGWNSAVPILLVAVAAGHSAQMLKRYAEEVVRLHDNREAVVASTLAVGPVMVAAGTTAALGFASLALFGVKAVANLGLSCAYGIASCVLLEVTFIPALRAVLPAPRRVSASGGVTDRVLSSFYRSIVRNRGQAVMIGTAVVLVIAVLGIFRIRTYGPTREYMPKDSLPRRHLEKIEEHFRGTTTMTMLYEGEAGTTKRIEILRHMSDLQDFLATNPVVLRTASLADLVKELHKTFNAEDPKPYRLPDGQDLASQLLFLGDSPAFERFTGRAYAKGIVMAYLETDDSALVGPLIDKTRAWAAAHPLPEGVKLLIAGGAGPTVYAVNEHTTYGKLLNMLMVLLVIYVVASLLMRSPLVGLYVVSPIAMTVVELFGLLGWTGVKFDMGSSSVIAMAAGLGADYAIYFLYRLREEYAQTHDDERAMDAALHTSGRAVLFVAGAIGAGFAVLGFSKFLGHWLFGTLMPTAMILSCFSALTLMPALVLRTRPGFIFGQRVELRDEDDRIGTESPAVR